MWIISTHIGISCLLCVTAIGFKAIFKEQLQRYHSNKKVHFRRIKFALGMFVPVLNVLMLAALIHMIECSDEEAEEIMDRQRENK